MTAKKRFFLNGLLLTAVGLSMRTVTLFFNAFVSRTVGAEGIGLFTLIMTVYGFASTFATSGISLTMTRLVAGAIGDENRGRVPKILLSGVLYALAFGTVATLVLFFFAPLIAEGAISDVRAVSSMRILALSLVPSALLAVFSGYFVGVKRVAKNALTQVLGQGTKIILTLLFVGRAASLGVERACFALSLTSTLTDVLACGISYLQFVYDRRREKRHGAGDASLKAEGREVASMALPLAVSAYIRSALLSLEHMLIPNRLRAGGQTQADALASYGILHGMALPLLLYPMAPLSSFSGLLVPEFAESHASGAHGRMKRIADRALNLTLVYAIATAVFVYLFSEELGYRIYGSYYAGYYIAMLAPVIPIMYLDHVTDAMLKGIGEHVYSMWVNISDSLLSVILVIVLLPKMGIAGYAVVIIAMEAYNFVFSVVRLRRRIPFSIDFLRSILIALLGASASALISKSIFCMNGDATTGIWLILKIVFAVCLFIAFYIVSTWILDVFSKNKRKMQTNV